MSNQPSPGPSWFARVKALLKNWWVLLLLFAIGWAGQFIVARAFGGLQTPAAPNGIVSLELARDREAAHAILESWAGPRMWGALLSLLFDFVFLFAYSFLLRRLVLWAAPLFHPRLEDDGSPRGVAERGIEWVENFAHKAETLSERLLGKGKNAPWLVGPQTRASEDSAKPPPPARNTPHDPRPSLVNLLGPIIALGQIFAGIFDVFENVFLLCMVIPSLGAGAATTPSAAIPIDLGRAADLASWCAIFKFALISIGLIYILAGIRFHPYIEGALTVARRARFSLYISLLTAVVLLIPPGQDGLRTLAEDAAAGSWHHMGWFVFAAIIFAWLNWWGARAVELATPERAKAPDAIRFLAPLITPDNKREAGRKQGGREASVWLPRLCASLPLLLFIYALISVMRTTGFDGYLLALLIVLALLAGLIPFLLTQRLKTVAQTGSNDWSGFFLRWWRDSLVFLGPEPAVNASKNTPGQQVILARILPFLAGVILWVMTVAAPLTVGTFGSAGVLLIGLGLIIPIGSLLVYLTERTGFPFLSVLMGAVLLFGYFDLADNHRVRECHSEGCPGYVATIPQSVEQPPVASLKRAFNDWLIQRPDRQPGGRFAAQPYPVVFVAAEGGGIRATYMASHVLAALQQQCPEFAEHTFLISSVSGGSLGAAVFVGMTDLDSASAPATGPPMPAPTGFRGKDGDSWVTVADKIVGVDLLAPTAACLLTGELFQRFFPLSLHGRDADYFDRSYSLELALEAAFREATRKNGDETQNPLERSFYDLYVREDAWAQRNVPALFMNTTNVEKGDRVVVAAFAPCETDPKDNACIFPAPRRGYTGNSPRRFTDNDGMWNVAPGINGLRSLTGIAPDLDLRLSTAACLSARFPLFSPSATLAIRQVANRVSSSATPAKNRDADAPTRLKQRLVDGGYFENSGISTVNDVLELLDAEEPWKTTGGKKDVPASIQWYPVVIEIHFDGRVAVSPADFGAVLSGERPGDARREFPVHARPATGLFDWISGFVDATGAHSDLAKARLEARLKQIKAHPVTSIVFVEDKTPLPTNWLISKKSRFEIQYQTGGAIADTDPGFKNLKEKAEEQEAKNYREGNPTPAERQRARNHQGLCYISTTLGRNPCPPLPGR